MTSEQEPSVPTLLLSGIVAGGVLGAANGALCYLMVGAFETLGAACLWGLELGILGGVIVVFVRRALWGPDISPEIGTTLGWLYGIVPGVVVFYQAMAMNRAIGKPLIGLVLASSMAGLILGGLLDRITEAIIARRRRHVERLKWRALDQASGQEPGGNLLGETADHGLP